MEVNGKHQDRENGLPALANRGIIAKTSASAQFDIINDRSNWEIRLGLIIMRKSKLIKILVPIGLVFLIVFVVIPPFTRKWYRSHAMKYAPPLPPTIWKKFSSEEGKFSILFPGVPVEENQTVTNSNSTAIEHIFYVNADIEDAYLVGYYDDKKYEEAVKNGKAQELLKSCESFFAAGKGGGVVLSEQESTFRNFPAREFELRAGGKANYSVRVKYLINGHRLYTVTTVFLTANPHPVDCATFFNSFRLRD